MRLLRDVPLGGTGLLHQGDEYAIDHEFSGGVVLRISSNSDKVILHTGSYEFI